MARDYGKKPDIGTRGEEDYLQGSWDHRAGSRFVGFIDSFRGNAWGRKSRPDDYGRRPLSQLPTG